MSYLSGHLLDSNEFAQTNSFNTPTPGFDSRLGPRALGILGGQGLGRESNPLNIPGLAESQLVLGAEGCRPSRSHELRPQKRITTQRWALGAFGAFRIPLSHSPCEQVSSALGEE